MTFDQEKQLTRLLRILRRHVRAEDRNLTDDQSVRILFDRYEQSRRDYLVDPAE